VRHGRYVAFQMTEIAIPRNLFADLLRVDWGIPSRSFPLSPLIK